MALTTGDVLSRDQFLRIWEGLPSLKGAELIDGVVFVAPPVSYSHGMLTSLILYLLKHYEIATPGCQAGNNGTWMMLGSAPQLDTFLRILPQCGGQSQDAGEYPSGAPELAVEVCITSTEVDFGRKLALYQRAGVHEYITVEEVPTVRITWRVLQDDGSYAAMPADPDGVFRSRLFPGLWLDNAAVRALSGEAALRTLNAGIATAEHAAFIERLERAARVH